MDKNFILKTVETTGVEKNVILGKTYTKIKVYPNVDCKDTDLLEYLKDGGEGYLASDMPFTDLFIKDEDHKIYEILPNVKEAYITCNGTTVEKLKIVDPFESSDEFIKFWAEFLNTNVK